MPWDPPARDASIVLLSGAGLSAASGIPTFRGPGGYWQGHKATDLATPEAFRRDPALVRAFYDMRREVVARAEPNAAHQALVRLQAGLGVERVMLVTQNIDGLLQRAAAQLDLPVDVVEMHGSLARLQCAGNPTHPRVPITGAQDPDARCAACNARLRPAVVWFGERPEHMDCIGRALDAASIFLSIGTSGVVYPAAGFVDHARQRGLRCYEINPDPTAGVFHDHRAEGAEVALPPLVEAWLAGRAG